MATEVVKTPKKLYADIIFPVANNGAGTSIKNQIKILCNSSEEPIGIAVGDGYTTWMNLESLYYTKEELDKRLLDAGAISLNNFEAFNAFFGGEINTDVNNANREHYVIGQTILLVQKDAPDFWISGIVDANLNYGDERWVNSVQLEDALTAIQGQGWFQLGKWKFSELENDISGQLATKLDKESLFWETAEVPDKSLSTQYRQLKLESTTDDGVSTAFFSDGIYISSSTPSANSTTLTVQGLISRHGNLYARYSGQGITNSKGTVLHLPSNFDNLNNNDTYILTNQDNAAQVTDFWRRGKSQNKGSYIYSAISSLTGQSKETGTWIQIYDDYIYITDTLPTEDLTGGETQTDLTNGRIGLYNPATRQEVINAGGTYISSNEYQRNLDLWPEALSYAIHFGSTVVGRRHVYFMPDYTGGTYSGLDCKWLATQDQILFEHDNGFISPKNNIPIQVNALNADGTGQYTEMRGDAFVADSSRLTGNYNKTLYTSAGPCIYNASDTANTTYTQYSLTGITGKVSDVKFKIGLPIAQAMEADYTRGVTLATTDDIPALPIKTAQFLHHDGTNPTIITLECNKIYLITGFDIKLYKSYTDANNNEPIKDTGGTDNITPTVLDQAITYNLVAVVMPGSKSDATNDVRCRALWSSSSSITSATEKDFVLNDITDTIVAVANGNITIWTL